MAVSCFGMVKGLCPSQGQGSRFPRLRASLVRPPLMPLPQLPPRSPRGRGAWDAPCQKRLEKTHVICHMNITNEDNLRVSQAIPKTSARRFLRFYAMNVR